MDDGMVGWTVGISCVCPCDQSVVGRLLRVLHDGEPLGHQYQSWPSGGTPVLLPQQTAQSLGGPVPSGVDDDAQLVVPRLW